MGPNKIHFVASVDDEHLDQINEIVKKMEGIGFYIEKVRKITGTISGIVDSVNSFQEAKARIKGIKEIDSERSYTTQISV